jgi:hypothetical protein
VEKAKAALVEAEKGTDAAVIEAAKKGVADADAALAAAKKAVEAVTAEKTAAEKVVADAKAKHKGVVDSLPGLKAAADKAVAEMNPTPEMTKALEAATAAAKVAAETRDWRQLAVTRLTAELQRGATAGK